MERICPHCGASDNSISFVGERCLNCFLERSKIRWADKIEIEACQKCGRIRRGKDWKESHPTLIAAIAQAAMKGVPGHYNIERQVWEGVWEEGGSSAAFERPLPIDWKKAVCPTCNRESSGYFEGIIQLRGDRAKVEKYAARLKKILEKRTFLPKVEEMHGGMDIYVGEKKDVAEILFHQGLKYERSEKLSGEKNGKRLYRSTFLIRFGEGGEMSKGRISSGG